MGKKGYYYKTEECLYDFTDKDRCLDNYIFNVLNRTQKIFKYKNLPDSIPQYILELMLQINGFVCFTKVNDVLYCFEGGLGGEPDVYYRPTICTVSNPALKFNKTLKIDQDCVIVRNDTFLQGLIPIIKKYCSLLVESDISFDLVIKNLRIAGIISATDDDTKTSAEKFLCDIAAGTNGIVASSEFLEGVKVQPLSVGNNNVTQLLEIAQYCKASMFNDLGLNSNFNMKREILTDSENEMNSDTLLPFVDNMLETRKQDIEKVNKMFGTNIEVELDSAWNIQREEVKNSLEEQEDVKENNVVEEEEKDGQIQDQSE